jgi:LytS/YehU family sensor histidine kinase
VYYLIPKYLLIKKYKSFLLLFSGVAIFFILLQRVVVFTTYPVLYPEYKMKQTFFEFNYLYTFFNIYVMPALFASVKLFEYWFVNQKRNQELEKEKMESELKFLKSQIHPHFLFNTLNNLYALTLDKSDHAPEVVVKLSDLLSYMLYECNAPLVPLAKEVQLLQDYLDLEKIRYHSELKVDFEILGRVNGKNIAPLVLLPFVENGFKHGLSKQINNPWINITLEIEDYLLKFTVENNKPRVDKADETGYSEGIGLKNVRRRLDLIYGDQYSLEISGNSDNFSINLQLKLHPQTKEKQS